MQKTMKQITTAAEARDPFENQLREIMQGDDPRAEQEMLPAWLRERKEMSEAQREKIKAAQVRFLAKRKRNGHLKKMRALSQHAARREEFCRGLEKEVVTESELKTLRALQLRCDKLNQQLAENGYDGAGKMKSAKNAYEDDPSPENLAKLKSCGPLDRDAARERQRLIMRPIREATYRCVHEAVPVIETIFERVAQLAEAESDRIKGEEEKTAARFGVPHEYGPIHGSLHRLADNLRMKVCVTNTPPRVLLAGVVKL